MSATIIFGEETPLEKRILEEIEAAMSSIAPYNHRILELIMKHRQEVRDEIDANIEANAIFDRMDKNT